MSFEARFRGACADCDDGVTPGEEIQFRGEGENRVIVHVACPETVTVRSRPVCGDCWLEHPEGACDL